MAQAEREGIPGWLLAYPGTMLVAFFLVPFGIMLAVSFFEPSNASFHTTLVTTNYARLLAPAFVRVMVFSLYLGILVAVISVSIALPFAYFVARLPTKLQTIWLVFLLSVLSLSEVIIGFSWSVLLSRTAGISNLLVWLGLLDHPRSFVPGFTAELLGYGYLTFPYTVLMLYPPVSRLNPEWTEAARTMGASPIRAFFTVVLPALRRPIFASLILAFVFTLGVYLIPQILAEPPQWTLSVLITDQAVAEANLPFSAALAMLLLAASLALIAITLLAERHSRRGGRAPQEAGGQLGQEPT